MFFECVIHQGAQTEGRIRTAHLGEDVLKWSGAALLTVERPAEQRSPDAAQGRSTSGGLQVITRAGWKQRDDNGVIKVMEVQRFWSGTNNY